MHNRILKGRWARRVAGCLVLLGAIAGGLSWVATGPFNGESWWERDRSSTRDRLTVIDDTPCVIEAPRLLTHVIDVVNPTEQAIQVVALQAACACSSASLSRWRLEPQESAELRLEVQLDGRPRRNVDCLLRLADGSRWVYRFRPHNYPRLAMPSGNAHLSLGVLGAELRERRFSFALYGTLPPPLPVVKASQGPLDIRVLDQGLQETQPKGLHRRQFELAIRVPRQKFPQGGTQEAFLDLLDTQRRQTHKLSVSWTEQSDYQITPPRLYLGLASDDRPHELRRSVTICSMSGRPFQVRQADVNDQRFVSAIERIDSNCYSVEVSVPAAAVPETLSRTLSVAVENGSTTTLKIPLSVLAM